MIFNWLSREGLHLMQTLDDEEEEKSKTSIGLFKVLIENFKPQHNETLLSLQYCKQRKQSKNPKE